MSEIKECIDELLVAVRGSEEYQDFVKYRDLLKENPELMNRVNTFRGNNFRLQNEANRDELFRAMEQLNRESRELRRDPLVNAFLDAELALCKLMQKICKTLTEGIDLDIPEL
nr:YlbF family regulator [uncultured Blautia sp.]